VANSQLSLHVVRRSVRQRSLDLQGANLARQSYFHTGNEDYVACYAFGLLSLRHLSPIWSGADALLYKKFLTYLSYQKDMTSVTFQKFFQVFLRKL
jgi:hypothetical protein